MPTTEGSCFAERQTTDHLRAAILHVAHSASLFLSILKIISKVKFCKWILVIKMSSSGGWFASDILDLRVWQYVTGVSSPIDDTSSAHWNLPVWGQTIPTTGSNIIFDLIYASSIWNEHSEKDHWQYTILTRTPSEAFGCFAVRTLSYEKKYFKIHFIPHWKILTGPFTVFNRRDKLIIRYKFLSGNRPLVYPEVIAVLNYLLCRRS